MAALCPLTFTLYKENGKEQRHRVLWRQEWLDYRSDFPLVKILWLRVETFLCCVIVEVLGRTTWFWRSFLTLWAVLHFSCHTALGPWRQKWEWRCSVPSVATWASARAVLCKHVIFLHLTYTWLRHPGGGCSFQTEIFIWGDPKGTNALSMNTIPNASILTNELQFRM